MFRKILFDNNIKKKLLTILIISAIFISSTIIIYLIIPVQSHWTEIYRPAALKLLNGKNPYIGINFFNPPWALIPLIPFAVLPEKLGNALLCSITFLSFAYIAIKFGAKPITLILFLTLPLTLYNIIQVNVDWLVAWGFLFPPQIGLFFILMKPQLGIFLAIYWFVDSWKLGGIKTVLIVFCPVIVAFLLSFILFGNYFQTATVVFEEANKTFWPASISVGLVIMVLAFRLKKSKLTISAAPLLTPYVQPYSLPLAIFGLLPDQPLTITLILGLWFIFLDPSRLYIIQRLFELFNK